MWHLENHVHKIRVILDGFDDFIISHIKRKGNYEEDTLSKWATSFQVIGGMQFEICDHWQNLVDEEFY